MKTISALEVRAKFGQVLDEAAAGERFVVERAGQPVAAIIPLADLAAIDPDRAGERRRAAAERLAWYGARNRRLHGEPATSSAGWIRRDRDGGHRQ